MISFEQIINKVNKKAMTLKEQYKKETNLEVYILDRFTGDFDNTKYVEWLEAKINYTHSCTELCEVCNCDQVFETEDGYTADCPRCNQLSTITYNEQ